MRFNFSPPNTTQERENFTVWLERVATLELRSGKKRGGRMPQGMSGNNRHPRTLAGELEACVEGLVAKGRAVPARKDERGSREVDSPSPQPHSLYTFQKSEPLLE